MFVPPTNTFTTGDELPGGVQAFPMHHIEEAAFWLPGYRAVVFGDSVLGYDDGRAGARRILDLEPERLLLTHGGPRDAAELKV